VQTPASTSSRAVAEQRVGAQVGGDLLRPAVAGLDVGAGVGHQADGAQVQERGRAVPAHPRRGGRGGLHGVDEVAPVGGEVLEARGGCRTRARSSPRASAR
jgi:hypothetical protein